MKDSWAMSSIGKIRESTSTKIWCARLRCFNIHSIGLITQLLFPEKVQDSAQTRHHSIFRLYLDLEQRLRLMIQCRQPNFDWDSTLYLINYAPFPITIELPSPSHSSSGSFIDFIYLDCGFWHYFPTFIFHNEAPEGIEVSGVGCSVDWKYIYGWEMNK